MCQLLGHAVAHQPDCAYSMKGTVSAHGYLVTHQDSAAATFCMYYPTVGASQTTLV